MIGAGSAIGGGCISTAGNVIVDNRRRAADDVRAEKEVRRHQDERRRETLEALATAYDNLGDIPRRASLYAETGTGGSASDLRVVVRHFGTVLRTIRTDVASPAEIARYYGGRMRGWAQRFYDLGERRAPGAKSLSEAELYNLRLLGPALSEVAASAIADHVGISALSDYETMSNDTMMSSNVLPSAM